MANGHGHGERRGHVLAFGDDTDELAEQPVGRRLTRPQGVGAPDVTDHDIEAGIEQDSETEEDSSSKE
jgi:hypothetical protein